MKRKKITLNFSNGSSVTFTKKTKNIEWESVDSVRIERWETLEQLKKLYPELKNLACPATDG